MTRALLAAATLLAAPAHAADAAWTLSYRALAGASVRYEAPLADTVSALVEGGLSGWLVYGDDPHGGTPSPVVVRPHVKTGLDLHPGGDWYVGPRVVGARNESILNTGRSFWEVGAMGTVGVKSTSASGSLTQVGFGLGAHVWIDPSDDEVAVFLLPHLELRLGRAITRSRSAGGR